MTKTPRFFDLCFEAHRTDGNVVAVRVNGRWIVRPRVECDVPIRSVYKGAKAKQPRFYFRGYGYVSTYKDYVHIGYGR